MSDTSVPPLHLMITGARSQLAYEIMRQRPGFVTPFNHEQLDISVIDVVRERIDQIKPKIVINCAGYRGPDTKKSARVNYVGASVLATVCKEKYLPLIHISSAEVFDGKKPSAYAETDKPNPHQYFAKDILMGEEMIAELLPKHVIIRTSWLYSKTGDNFINNLCHQIITHKNQTIDMSCDQYGSPTSAADLARAIITVASKINEHSGGWGSWGTFHFCNQGAATPQGIAETLYANMKEKWGLVVPAIRGVKGTAGIDGQWMANRQLYTQRFEHAFGVLPRPWRDALADIT